MRYLIQNTMRGYFVLLHTLILLLTLPAIAKVQKKKAVLPKTKTEVRLTKTPRALFLIKRTRLDAAIGEPVIYPFELQLRNLYYDHGGDE